MEVLTAYCTDLGIRKKTNQDSLCIEVAETSMGTIVMAMICDGMGGLSKGELASASVVKAFRSWFNKGLPLQINNAKIEDIRYSWDRIIKEQNYKIGKYGTDRGILLGTTLTVFLNVGGMFWLAGHVGDSRLYRITDKLEILTEDHTVVNYEIQKGRLTEDEAKIDLRRNVLLQCIGASRTVNPQYLSGKSLPGDVYMLCSDGFRHEISKKEIYDSFRPEILLNEEIMEKRIKELVELNKKRNEKDNITVILLKF